MNRKFFWPRWGKSSQARRTRTLGALKRRKCQLETLEARSMMAADIRTYDGTGNNLLHSDWGSTGEDLLRKVAAAYADSKSSPAGDTRLSAREISNLVAAHPADPIINERALSAFIYAWGQFLDHDIDLSPDGTEEFSGIL